MLCLKLRTILALLGTTLFFAVSYSQEATPSFNKGSYGELFADLTENVNTSLVLADFGNVNKSYPDQQRIVNGRVTDSNGNPLAGVNIIEKNTTNGVLTSSDGNFSIKVASENSILVFSFIGFTAQEITVGARNSFSITLAENLTIIEEVVIVGYGKQKKEKITGAVSSATGEKLMQTPQIGVSNLLNGRLSGLVMKQSSGMPGRDASSIKIRGVGTFSGSSNPLILIDGIESSTGNFMGAQYLYLPTEFNTMDPNEIENISVLKDAASTAVYGVRGANGVILVTTKKGRIGKPEISFTTNVSMSQFNKVRKGLDAYNWTKTYNEGLKYDSYISGSYVPSYSAEEIEHFRTHDDPIFFPDTDWVKDFIKPYSFQSQQNFNIRGGTKAIRYFVSLGHSNQESIYKHSTYRGLLDAQSKINRFNFRSNVDIDITKRFSASINLSSQITNQTGGGLIRNWGYQLVIQRLYLCSPIVSPGIVDGKIVNVRDFYQTNPYYWLLAAGYRSEYTNNLSGSVRLNYKLDFITKGLSIRGFGTYAHPLMQYKEYNKTLVTYKPARLPDNSISYYPEAYDSPYSFGGGNDYNITVSSEFGLDYKRTFGDNNISGLVLYTQLKQYPGPSLSIPRGFQGLVGRLTYDYKARYLAEFNVGYNGTENFAKGRRFGLFPAFSLGWIVSEENFFPKNNIVSYVKLRGSYGEVGNDQVGGNRFLYLPTTYLFVQDWQGAGYLGEEGSTFYRAPGAIEQQWGNPLLTWERAKKIDLGIDLAFFNNKLKITADWFQEKRDNILAYPGTVPIIVGAYLPNTNLGRMKNGGYDGDIRYTDKIGNFTYWVGSNFTAVHNTLIYQDEVVRTNKYQYRSGKRLGQPFGLLDEGLYTSWDQVLDAYRPVSNWNSNLIQPGDLRYKDVNGDGKINTFDQVPMGNTNAPQLISGLSFGGEYKGIDFSVLFQGATQVSYYPAYLSIRGFANNGMCAKDVAERAWTQEKWDQGLDIEYFPRISATSIRSHNYQASSFWQRDASFIRFKSFEIGYTLRSNFMKRAGMNSARFYVSGENLMVFSKAFPGEDPEMADGDDGAYPPSRIFNIGLNVKF